MTKWHKYRARSTIVDGIKFASVKEARRYGELKLLQKAGKIRNLELQPRFPLIVGGVKVCEYRADFVYHDDRGKIIVEDVKGYKKIQVYQIKKKLFEAIYLKEGLKITEV